MVMCTLYQAAGDVVVYFLIAPSIGVVYLVTETGKWALLEPGRTLKVETWSRGIFFQCVKTGVVDLWMAPSIGVVCLVAKTQKWVLVEPGAIQEAETWSRGIFFNV